MATPLNNLGGGSGSGGWRSYFYDELERLCSLIPDAGGYGPKRPTQEIVQLARKVVSDIARDDLPRPLVIPGSDGSIQMKWRKSARELSFFVFSSSIEYLTVESHTVNVLPAGITDAARTVNEGDLKNPAQLNEFVDWLLRA
jgi:hypothetical protein